jgi:hypothetical protein
MRWYSTDAEDLTVIVNAWPDAPISNEVLLGTLLEIAKEQVLAYAPGASGSEQVALLLDSLGATPETIAAVLDLLDGTFPGDDLLPGADVLPGDSQLTDPPARYVYAQLQQAKNLWNAGRVAATGEVGADGFSFAPRPLDRDIQRIIRPLSGAASVF